MKKITYLATICGLILLGLSSCQKENLKGGQFTATIAQMNNDDKVTYDGQGFAWQNGDEIKVRRKHNSSSTFSDGLYRTTLGEGENAARTTFSYVDNHAVNNYDVTDNSTYTGKFYATYPEAIAPVNDSYTANRVRLPSIQPVAYNNGNPIIEGFPMYAECNAANRLLKFKNLCGLLKLHLQKANTTVSSIVVSTEDGALNGLFNIVPTRDDDEELISATLTQSETVTDERKAIAVQFPAQNIANGKDFFIYLPAREYNTLTITITDNTGNICTKSLNSTHTFHIGASEWSSITLQNDDLVFEEIVVDDIPGARPGIFTVGVGKTVVFSQGNLQYRPSDNTYQFAANQYDRISYTGTLSDYYTSTSTEWLDLFPWATSGYNDKYPYYIGANNTYGNGSNSLVGTNANYDWGVNNPISNGGNEAGLWRTLTKDEWEYLISSRDNHDQRWTKGIVNNVPGLILLPDTWTTPSGVTLNLGTSCTYRNRNGQVTSNNTLSLEQWQLLENAGAIFLPITGYIKSSDWTFVSVTNGYYWSTTNCTSTYAYRMNMSTGNSAPSNTSYSDRSYCLAVRLVHDVE